MLCERFLRCQEIFRERVDRFDVRHSSRIQGSKLSDEEMEQLYLDRLDAGLYTLQRVTLVLADVCANGSSGCRNRAVKLFQMRTGNGKLTRHLTPVSSILKTTILNNCGFCRHT